MTVEETIDYQQLAHELVRMKAVSSTPRANGYASGPGGLFSAAGLSKPVFTAMTIPHMGLQSILPVRPSMEMNPLHAIITGVSAVTGSDPTGVCDDPKVVGLTKLCTHSAVFGRSALQTQVYDLDRFGQVTNRGEFQDFQILGGPRSVDVPMAIPNLGGTVNNDVKKTMFEFAVGWAREFSKELYTGNPTNNTSGGGRQYFYGLDTLINTGYRDAVTGVACAAADAIVRSFNNAEVAGNAGSLVTTITNIYRNLRYIASRTGLNPVKWAITMPWGLFYDITEVWPCAYFTVRCATASPTNTTSVVNVAAENQVKLRDDMRGNVDDRTGQYLMIDGQQVPVILDDAITETEVGSGVFSASIYFVPLTVLGGTPVTYIEYLNYDSPAGALAGAQTFAPQGTFYTSDSGRFFWIKKPPTNFCVQLEAKTQTRVMLDTPYLSARLTNVRWRPIYHERSPWSTSGYFAEGGVTDYGGYGPSYYTPTS
jgi:hypothetical protein